MDSRAAPSSRPKRSRRRGGATTRGVWSTGARAPKHLGPVMVSRLVGRPRAARRGRGPVRGSRQEPLIVFRVGFQAELVSVMLFHRVDTAGHTSHLRRMQSPTDPSDRGRHHRRRGLRRGLRGGVPDGRRLTARRRVRAGRGRRGVRGAPADRRGRPPPRRLRRRHPTHRGAADQHRRRRRREHGPGGKLGGGGGARRWGRTGPLRPGDDGARRHLTGGRPVRLPDHRDGWRWEPYAVDGADVDAARQQPRSSRRSGRLAGCPASPRLCTGTHGPR